MTVGDLLNKLENNPIIELYNEDGLLITDFDLNEKDNYTEYLERKIKSIDISAFDEGGSILGYQLTLYYLPSAHIQGLIESQHINEHLNWIDHIFDTKIDTLICVNT